MNGFRQVAPCPYCKGTSGWFERRCDPYLQYFKPGGETSHAEDSSRRSISGGRRKYCYDCNRIITKLIQPIP